MGSIFTAADRLAGETLRDNCFPLVGVVPADQTVNNSTTPVPMAGFAFQLDGDTHYAFDGYIAYSTNATADIQWLMFGQFARSFTNQAMFTMATVHHTAAGNPGNLDGAFLTLLNLDPIFGTFGGAGSATPTMAALPHGTLYTGREPGMLQFFFAQNTANASNTTVLAGSWARFTKLGTGE